MVSIPQHAMNSLCKRYASIVTASSVMIGTALILLGFAPLGKGLILGALFSVLNFIIMAMVLPYHLGHRRYRSFLMPLTSLCGRMALLAVPMIFAVKYPQIAVSTAALGLFMVPLTILGERLWQRWRQSERVGSNYG